MTGSKTVSLSRSASRTASKSKTNTPTPSVTKTPTGTSSSTDTPTPTQSTTSSTTLTVTSTVTPSGTQTSTLTPTSSPTGTSSPSSSETSTLTPTQTSSKTPISTPLSSSISPSTTHFPSAEPPLPSESSKPQIFESITPSLSPTFSNSLQICGNLCNMIPNDEIVPLVDYTYEYLDITAEGNNIGSVIISQSSYTDAGYLIITAGVISSDTDTSRVLSPIVDLTLLDSSGNEISIFENSVELCLEVDPAAGEVCSYFLTYILQLLTLNRITYA